MVAKNLYNDYTVSILGIVFGLYRWKHPLNSDTTDELYLCDFLGSCEPNFLTLLFSFATLHYR